MKKILILVITITLFSSCSSLIPNENPERDFLATRRKPCPKENPYNCHLTKNDDVLSYYAGAGSREYKIPLNGQELDLDPEYLGVDN